MLHFSKTAPLPCTPTPREQGKARPQNKKEQPVGLHFDLYEAAGAADATACSRTSSW
jgi:hypothetical protein